MRAYLPYLLRRLGQFVLVVFIGINIAFVVTHATPIDPVEQTISAATSFGSTSPEAIAKMRESLRELYGVQGGLGAQYVSFWKRVAVGDFGPSLSAFPTPVSTLIARALPWTAGLLTTSTLIAWCLGNLLGGLAGYYRDSRFLRVAGLLAMGVHPVPYYIVAFVLLIIFGYLWPILPISGGAQMNLAQSLDLPFILSVLRHSILPALSLVLVGIGSWFMGMRALVSNLVTEDYVAYAESAASVGAGSSPPTSCAMRSCRRSPGSRFRSAPSSTVRSSPSKYSAIPASARCSSMPSMPAITAWFSASLRSQSSPCPPPCC